MSNKLYEESAIQDIANAIRSKSGTSDTFKVAEMGDAVRAIPQGGVTPTGTINITTNGTHDVTQYASASVNVPTSEPSGNITITENGTGIDVANYATATVAVPGPSGSQTFTQNGTYDVSAIAQAVINVSGGGSPFPSNYHIGQFILDGSESEKVVAHGCANKPAIVFVALDSAGGTIGNSRSFGALGVSDVNCGIATNYQGLPSINLNWSMMTIDVTNFTFKPRLNYPFVAGTYHWIAIE